ncbi:MAG: bifunctional phosphoribosylaminoimidazolecarboxamide formyltransferase/IMP cyclohydrolase [Deltaproteobacteria bacterium]|nr:bifunctional phosphoribosylaminoimidazolecarboxamide formyltransferase/IMP cyclohydrolase [Deltaproteobacteria bacterium]
MKDIAIKRALISVSKKEGILEFARVLHQFGVEILSTGNTAEMMKKEGIPVTKVSDYTGSPEILDGRVKTLHPKIHGGLLGRREDSKHVKEMEAHQIQPIDLVVVNLYPFEETVSKEGVPFSEIIENIDIGGPSMIRSAAKNFESVAVVVDPADYAQLIEQLQEKKGSLARSMRWYLAQKAFSHTAAYDGAISNYLTRLPECEWNVVPTPEKYPRVLNLQVQKDSNLRYGENPHQAAAFYRSTKVTEPCVGNAQCLHGKELSFNNLLDLDAALETVKEFQDIACVIIKHNNPCGAALGISLKDAFLKAKACDPTSAFGGIVGVNRKVDFEFAEEFNKTFFEAIIAPEYEATALDLLRSKKNLRILKTPHFESWIPEPFEMKKIVGGLLVQDRDLAEIEIAGCRVVTELAPTPEQLQAMAFAWKVARHVKSNAILYAKSGRIIGIGAGQMSRIDSVKIGAMKAQESLDGCVLASDAFFPFRDGIDAAAANGVKAIIQPGGSVRDEEVIQAANEHGIAMVFTGMRHFRH